MDRLYYRLDSFRNLLEFALSKNGVDEKSGIRIKQFLQKT
jgi:hypothetical protein